MFISRGSLLQVGYIKIQKIAKSSIINIDRGLAGNLLIQSFHHTIWMVRQTLSIFLSVLLTVCLFFCVSMKLILMKSYLWLWLHAFLLRFKAWLWDYDSRLIKFELYLLGTCLCSENDLSHLKKSIKILNKLF